MSRGNSDRSAWGHFLAVSALIIAVIALLFGDNLLGRSGSRQDQAEAQRNADERTRGGETGPASNRAGESIVESSASNESLGSSLTDAGAVKGGAEAAIESISEGEWCDTGLSVLLKRVLRTTTVAGLERLANEGNPHAQLLVARGYLDGTLGFPKDPETSIYFFKRAALSRIPVTISALGAAQEMGVGAAPDEYAAVRLYREASDAGCLHAKVNLARSYMAGLGGLSQDSVKATQLYRDAAREGSDYARQALAKQDSE